MSEISSLIERNFMGDASIFYVVARIFLAKHKSYLRDLEESVNTGDTSAMQHAAHKLRGAVCSFGREKIVKQLEEIERDAKQNRISGVSVQEIWAEIEILEKFLEEALAAHGEGE